MILAGAFVAVFGLLLFRAMEKERSIRMDIAELEAAIERAEEKNKELIAIADRYSRPEFLEREARLRLNLKMPDEEVIVFQQDQTAAASTTTIPSARPAESSLLAEIWSAVRSFIDSIFARNITYDGRGDND